MQRVRQYEKDRFGGLRSVSSFLTLESSAVEASLGCFVFASSWLKKWAGVLRQFFTVCWEIDGITLDVTFIRKIVFSCAPRLRRLA